MLLVAGEDIFDVESPITAEIFIQDRDNSLHFSWSCTKPAASLGIFVATSIEPHCSLEGAVGEGITLTEDQFEELQPVRQAIGDRTDVESDASDEELEEQTGQCHMPARARSVAAGRFEFPQDITTFSDFKVESEVPFQKVKR